MSSKLEYLKRYQEKASNKKRKKRVKTSANLTILDDDANWVSTPDSEGNTESRFGDDPDDAPIVAQVRDDSVVKWQPLSSFQSVDDGAGQSPPRQKKKSSGVTDQVGDMSPPRKREKPSHISEDISPPRKREKPSHISEDISPPRKREKPSHVSEDMSPPRKREKPSHISENISPSWKREKASHINEDISCSRKREIPSHISEDISPPDDVKQFLEWGRGVAQTKGTFDKVVDEEYEMSKPLARYADDEDLERMLKERTREGDPMLLFMKKMKTGKRQAVHKGKPCYRGDSAPNRFGIRPGYRWDGVDRSNGYEKTWLAQASNKKAVAEESYKWSIEDM